MKAVLLKGYGSVDQLEYAEVPTPEPGADDVLVKVISTSVNPVDYKIRDGSMKDRMPVDFPYILGRDVAGEVVSAGPEASGFSPGQIVMGLVNHSYAEFLTAKVSSLALCPDGLDSQTAGALPLVTLTGAQLIELGVQPQSGHTVLVTGAVGSVGRSAVHVAKQHGARVIAGVKQSQLVEAQSLRCYLTIALDNEDALQSVPELDAIADTVGGPVIGKLVSKVKQGGVLASVLGEQQAAKDAGLRTFAFMAKPDPKRLFELASGIRDGAFSIPISSTMSLRDVRQAHQRAQEGAGGKIVLVP